MEYEMSLYQLLKSKEKQCKKLLLLLYELSYTAIIDLGWLIFSSVQLGHMIFQEISVDLLRFFPYH